MRSQPPHSRMKESRVTIATSHARARNVASDWSPVSDNLAFPAWSTAGVSKES